MLNIPCANNLAWLYCAIESPTAGKLSKTKNPVIKEVITGRKNMAIRNVFS